MEDLTRALRQLVRDRGHRPFLTFEDATTGERTELSGSTFENWVAKTANYFFEEAGLGPGERRALAGPAHWRLAVSVIAAWHQGVTVTLADVPAAPLEPAGQAVLAFGDDLPEELGAPGDVALEAPGEPEHLTRAGLFEAARSSGGGRILLTGLGDRDALVRGLLAAVLHGGSVVLAHGLDATQLERLADQERVTTRL